MQKNLDFLINLLAARLPRCTVCPQGNATAKQAFVNSILSLSSPCRCPFQIKYKLTPCEIRIWEKGEHDHSREWQGSQQNNVCCSCLENHGNLEARASWTTRFQASSRNESFSSHKRVSQRLPLSRRCAPYSAW